VPSLVEAAGMLLWDLRKSLRRDVSLTVSLHWTRSQSTDIAYDLNRIE
jgi:hypothetical protein